MAAYDDSPAVPALTAEPALLRAALEAEVPVLGVCLGARLLAVAAGAVARPGDGQQIGGGAVRTTPAAPADPLLPRHPNTCACCTGTATPWTPAGATLLASCDRYPVQAFRTGGSAWGLRFHLEVDSEAVDALATAAPGPRRPAGRGVPAPRAPRDGLGPGPLRGRATPLPGPGGAPRLNPGDAR
ncbi:gamma-glutamyl-gamma-aminobutyrate hydrolase family protein [Streptomyces sp. NPDC019937]|uniref:glutamine amidotransferase-related protein n=1 Tax=Streptomyces sp. NPDC019937 TaxID=3154787 RepID=UPI0033FED71A